MTGYADALAPAHQPIHVPAPSSTSPGLSLRGLADAAWRAFDHSAPERGGVTVADAELVARAAAGDRAAFGELVRRHQRAVFALAWRQLGSEEDAKDVTQAAFVRAWQGLASFRGDAGFRTWVCRIAINLALNHRRDRGRWRGEDASDDLDDGSPPAPDVLAAAEASQALSRAVETLPAKQRLVVELRVHEGMSFKEVAEVAACSEDSAKANFHHALKRLRVLLANAIH